MYRVLSWKKCATPRLGKGVIQDELFWQARVVPMAAVKLPAQLWLRSASAPILDFGQHLSLREKFLRQ